MTSTTIASGYTAVVPSLRTIPLSSSSSSSVSSSGSSSIHTSSSSSSIASSPSRLTSLYYGKGDDTKGITTTVLDKDLTNVSPSRSSSPSRPTLTQLIIQSDPEGKYGAVTYQRSGSSSGSRNRNPLSSTDRPHGNNHTSSSASHSQFARRTGISKGNHSQVTTSLPIDVTDDFFTREVDDPSSSSSSSTTQTTTIPPVLTIQDDFFSKETENDENEDSNSEILGGHDNRRQGYTSSSSSTSSTSSTSPSLFHTLPRNETKRIPKDKLDQEEIILLSTDDSSDNSSDSGIIHISLPRKQVTIPSSSSTTTFSPVKSTLHQPSSSTHPHISSTSSSYNSNGRKRPRIPTDSSDSEIEKTANISPSSSGTMKPSKSHEISPNENSSTSANVFQGVSSRAAAVVQAASRTVQNLPDYKRIMELAPERKEKVSQFTGIRTNSNTASTIPSSSTPSTSTVPSTTTNIRPPSKETSVPLRFLIAEGTGKNSKTAPLPPPPVNRSNSSNGTRPLPFSPPVWISTSATTTTTTTVPVEHDYIAVPMRPITLMTDRAVEQERLLAETASNQQLQMELELDRQRRLFLNSRTSTGTSTTHPQTSSRTNSSASTGPRRMNSNASNASLPSSSYGLPPSLRRSLSAASSTASSPTDYAVPFVNDNELTLDLAISLALGSNNYYEQLGLGSAQYNTETNESMIKKRYHTLARLLHPDKVKAHIQQLQQSASPHRQKKLSNLEQLTKDKDIAKLAEDAFKQVAEAYKVLTSS